MLPNFNDIVLRRNDLPGSEGAAKFPLSYAVSDGNQPIAVLEASSGLAFTGGGSPIHTFSTDTNGVEEIYLYASNFSTSNAVLTLTFGTGDITASPPVITSSSRINIQVNKDLGLSMVYPGISHRSTSSTSPLTLWACTTSADTMSVSGYIIRYYPVSPDENLVTRAGYSAS
tara:strand:+ start:1350 stop:1865 length:516 start_codon:yes stop_codon:yes gene_type:complete